MSYVIVTGGAGFIGSHLVSELLSQNYKVIVIDKLTYSGSLHNLPMKSKNLKLLNFDIANEKKMKQALLKYCPIFFFNLAAETHVDRSIDNPKNFINTNILGLFNILECLRNSIKKKNFKRKFKKFIHVSTDEVYGSTTTDKPFNTNTPYNPSSPYSASKAASDHLVISWSKTYNLPFIVTNCSNNFGPRQYPEKLIPLTIEKLFKGEDIPLYGSGLQKRDWIFVYSHIQGLILAAKNGIKGNTYLFGSGRATSNIKIVKFLFKIFKEYNKRNSNSLITYVEDRPAHDKVYLINSKTTQKKLKWKYKSDLFKELRITFNWYAENRDWFKKISQDSKKKYNLNRLGILKD